MQLSHSVLDNGFNVVTDYVPGAQAVAAHWVLRAGYRHESYPGSAHFLEHMLSKNLSGPDGAEVFRWLDDYSAGYNFTTGPENISAYAYVLPEYFSAVIQTLGKSITRPVWNKQIFEEQVQLVSDELRDTQASEYGPLFWGTREKLYAGHALARLPLGTAEEIQQMQEEYIINYMRDHFLAGDMALVVSGPLTHDVVLSLAQKNFGNVQAGKNKIQPIPAKTCSGSNYVFVKPHRERQGIAISSYGVDIFDPNYLSFARMMGLLKTRLHDFLRNGYNYDGVESCYAASFTDHGQNLISYFTDPSKAQRSVTEVACFIATPEKWPQKKAFELDSLRKRTGFAFGNANPMARADAIATKYEASGKIATYAARFEELEAVTFDSVKAAYDQFRSATQNVFGCGPCTELPSAAEINTIIAGVQGEQNVPVIFPA
jgi:predicted Zn-dependent peptidase